VAEPPTRELAEGMREELRGIGAALQTTIEDLEHAEALLQVEFNAGGLSGLRAEAIASIPPSAAPSGVSGRMTITGARR
jgi:hypothetical protein